LRRRRDGLRDLRALHALAGVALCSQAEYVGVLWGKTYYPWLLSALKESKSSIEVAMFHAALPDEDHHPTRKLLDALVAAVNSGVAVRVLLDRDKKGDPYGSTIINTPAFDLLTKAGVGVRLDAPDHLLHSKVVVLDRRIVVIGSHNWSCGSYFILALMMSASRCRPPRSRTRCRRGSMRSGLRQVDAEPAADCAACHSSFHARVR
jgi:hypothetical protein